VTIEASSRARRLSRSSTRAPAKDGDDATRARIAGPSVDRSSRRRLSSFACVCLPGLFTVATPGPTASTSPRAGSLSLSAIPDAASSDRGVTRRSRCHVPGRIAGRTARRRSHQPTDYGPGARVARTGECTAWMRRVS
jgi:hypothetical protein